MSVKTYSKSKNGSGKLSANFKVWEFACRDGSDTIYIDSDLVSCLQKIRNWAGKPVNVNSAYRTAAYNAQIGGASGSYHTKGMAADISVSGKTPDEVAKFAESLGMKGIGCYDSNNGYFTHLDTRPSKFYWRNHSVTPTNTFGGSQVSGYAPGDYEVTASVLNVRAGAGVTYAAKTYNQLTANAKEQMKKYTPLKISGYVRGMKCTVYEVNGNWGKTPSGWICLTYCKASA